MSRAKTFGINVTLVLASLAAFLGFGYLVNLIDPQPDTDLEAWLLCWAGISSWALASAILTFITEITDHLAQIITPTARGRHAR